MHVKYQKLLLSLVLDAIGFFAFFSFFDVVWAPLSAYLMTKIYKGKQVKIAAIISFIEEAVPFLDVIPTFTLMWIYTYLIQKKIKLDDASLV